MTKAKLGWWDGKRYWRCTEHVFSGERHDVGGHQCGHTAIADLDDEGNPTKCKTHSVEGKAKRKAKADEKYAAHRAKMLQQDTAFHLRREALAIIGQIAAGHNDPRGLCADWVARWEANEASHSEGGGA